MIFTVLDRMGSMDLELFIQYPRNPEAFNNLDTATIKLLLLCATKVVVGIPLVPHRELFPDISISVAPRLQHFSIHASGLGGGTITPFSISEWTGRFSLSEFDIPLESLECDVGPNIRCRFDLVPTTLKVFVSSSYSDTRGDRVQTLFNRCAQLETLKLTNCHQRVFQLDFPPALRFLELHTKSYVNVSPFCLGSSVVHAVLRLRRLSLLPEPFPSSLRGTMLPSLRTLSLTADIKRHGSHDTWAIRDVLQRAPNLRAIELGWKVVGEVYNLMEMHDLTQLEDPTSGRGPHLRHLRLIRIVCSWKELFDQSMDAFLARSARFVRKRSRDMQLEWWVIKGPVDAKKEQYRAFRPPGGGFLHRLPYQRDQYPTLQLSELTWTKN